MNTTRQKTRLISETHGGDHLRCVVLLRGDFILFFVINVYRNVHTCRDRGIPQKKPCHPESFQMT